jgi:hypothetical protein
MQNTLFCRWRKNTDAAFSLGLKYGQVGDEDVIQVVLKIK